MTGSADLGGVRLIDDDAAPDYEALFRASSAGLYRSLYAFTGGKIAVAEDAVAEAFARAIAQERPLRDPLAWIYRTAFRIAIDEHRHEQRLTPVRDAPFDPGGLTEVMDVLRRLPPNQRAVLVMHHVEGFTLTETAHMLGIAAPTARVHLHRARTKMRQWLGDEVIDG